jgi:small subunit ribosomal protein S20
MPNTKSAERRVRSNSIRAASNRGLKSRLARLEKGYRSLVVAGKKAEAVAALRGVASALDKAAKTGVIHRATADRKKSRLSVLANAVK